MRCELADNEWAAIKPIPPNKPRGVTCVTDRRVLNSIFGVLRSGAPWRWIATRDDKLAANYLAFIQFAPIRLWPRANEFVC